MGPKVSVIVSLYRGERYLEKFLENIAEQTWFEEIEFVVDHNEPTEMEIRMLDEFERAHPGRLKRMVREKVVPYSASWNRCIREASSDIVAIWNVDDLRAPDSLEVQAGPILAGEADLVFGDYIEVKGQGQKEGRTVRISSTPSFLYSKQMAFGPFFMFSRSLCEKAGYLDEQMRTSADFDLAIRLSYHARILAVDHILGYYLMERKGLSTNASTKRFIEDTVIGLRYGNFDHLYYDKIPQALDYDIGRVNSDDRWTEVSDCVPNYRYERRKRMMRSVCKGPFNYVKKQIQWRKRMLDFESSQ